MLEEADRQKITLVGQSRSGKTNLLSALLCNPNALEDLKIGPDAVENPSITTLAEIGSPEEESFHFLSKHQKNILKGRDSGNEGTEQVRGYPTLLSYDLPGKAQAKQGLSSFVFGRQVDKVTRKALPFTIIDGRGGDIASPDYINPNEKENQSAVGRQAEYRHGLDSSVGMIICMPIIADEFAAEMADHLVREISGTIQRKAQKRSLPPLRNVALVFTKYESLFSEDGFNAWHQATQRDEAKSQLARQAMIRRFRPVLHESTKAGGYRTLIFPASTFGFVAGDGASNFYNYPPAPGLLSRAIKDEDYNDPDMQGSGGVGLRDHFPQPLSEKDALTLWQPFNIAPPILFALTGRVCGPLVLQPEDLL